MTADAPRLIHPRHWPTWFGIGAIRALAVLPLPVLHALGTALGLAMFALAGARRHVARTNIDLCFPDLPPDRRRKLTRDHFVQLGRSVATTGVNWFAPAARLDRLFVIEGREHLDAVIDRGENVILLAPHFVALEIGGIYLSRLYPTISMYQFIKNPVVDRVVRRGRARFGIELVERRSSLHQLVRRIRAGRLFYYLPDQDPGRRQGLFVPFFGVEASTFPMLSRFARLSGARVIPCVTEQLGAGRGWRIRFGPPLEDFPSGNEHADARAMNRVIEQAVTAVPAQYFWVHKRFKTRPAGAPAVY